MRSFAVDPSISQAAAELEKAGVSFTLVDPKEYFHHCVGALRAAVQPGRVQTWTQRKLKGEVLRWRILASL